MDLAGCAAEQAAAAPPRPRERLPVRRVGSDVRWQREVGQRVKGARLMRDRGTRGEQADMDAGSGLGLESPAFQSFQPNKQCHFHHHDYAE